MSKKEDLERVLSEVSGENLVILISGHPDPDAIGSALAHQRICRELGVNATIAHVQGVSHRQNRALVKLLNVEMTQITGAEDLADYKFMSLVDTSTPEATIELPADLKVLTVVDHHRAAEPEVPFSDIQIAIGASSSIYASYLAEGLAPLNGKGSDDTRVATALLFGIQTDTDDFGLATSADFAAAAYVKPHSDSEVLKRVGRRTISANGMDMLGKALAELIVVRDFAVAGVGAVAATERDSIGTTADFILQREDIDTVLVYGIVEDRIDGSLRTDSPSVEPATFLQTVFGKDGGGRPYGGGRADKGGFQIPLGVLAECDNQDSLWQLVQQVVRSRLAKAVPDLEKELIRRSANGHGTKTLPGTE